MENIDVMITSDWLKDVSYVNGTNFFLANDIF